MKRWVSKKIGGFPFCPSTRLFAFLHVFEAINEIKRTNVAIHKNISNISWLNQNNLFWFVLFDSFERAMECILEEFSLVSRGRSGKQSTRRTERGCFGKCLAGGTEQNPMFFSGCRGVGASHFFRSHFLPFFQPL